MARTKDRGFQQSFSPSYTIRRWRLGTYIRLSKEDLKKGKDDSNSVKNQRDLLSDFYQKHLDEFESVSEYVDDGHTGTDANREDFQRLLSDVMSGRINCVIVKDLSRFARNYSDAGSLIDNLFVQMGVRFISLAENVDSYRDPDSVSSIIVPITNVMNDQYCYQTSKKIRQVFDYKRRNGQYIGAFAPYGYIKDPKEKHQLLVDPDAAEIVSGDPRNRIAYARRALCAWCSAPEKSKTAPKDEWQFRTDFSELRTEFPELVDADGTGWFLRHVADDDRHGSQASQLTGVFTPVARDDLITALLPGADKTGDNDAVFFYACCGFPHGFVIPDLKRVVREGMQFGQRDHDNNFLRHRLARSCGFPAALFGCGRFRHFVPPVGVWLWVEKKDTSSFQRKCPFRGR